MLSVIVSIGGSLLSFLSLRAKPLAYQLTLMILFLVSLTMTGELDMTLPVYVIFAVAPYFSLRKKFGLFGSLFILGALTYLSVGVLVQSPTGSIVTFLSRLFQFVAFYLFIGNPKIKRLDVNPFFLVVAATIAESIMGLYLINHGSMAFNDTSGEIRLVANSQPITGNIAIAVLPIIGYIYYRDKYQISTITSAQMAGLWSCVAILFIWVVLSGTRGYTLVFGACALYLVGDGLLAKSYSRSFKQAAVVCACLAAASLAVALALLQSQLLEMVDGAFRLSGSLGVREQENQVAIDFFRQMPAASQMFGIGIGAAWGNYADYVSAVIAQFGHTGTAAKYIASVGTTFHNFYANVLCMQGIAGVFLIVIAFGGIVNSISSTISNSEKLFRRYLLVYLASFALMLYYRWSADCGIGELIILALVLNWWSLGAAHTKRIPPICHDKRQDALESRKRKVERTPAASSAKSSMPKSAAMDIAYTDRTPYQLSKERQGGHL